MPNFEQYSVHCESCKVSFAPETKQCIHCGAPLGGSLMATLRSATSEARDPAEPAEPAIGRSWIWTLIAVLILGFQLFRRCVAE